MSDVLYHAKILPQLAARWPLFAYLRPRSACSVVKEAPLHLYSYLDDLSKDPACLDIIRLGERQEAEEKAIARVIGDEDEGGAPTLSDSPLAMALTCYFQQGTAWLIARQNEILPIILRSACASYVALCSGFFRGDVKALLDKLSEDPRLVLEVWHNPTLRCLAPKEWFATALDPHPIEKAVCFFLQGKCEDAITLLQQSAQSNPICAGICLGLEPTSERAEDWISVALGFAEAFYWMSKVWHSGGKKLDAHPHQPRAMTDLYRDPRWYYHWMRDVVPEEALRRLPEIWPSPWAVELVLDLGLPIGLVPGSISHKWLDPKKALDSAILRWAADNALVGA